MAERSLNATAASLLGLLHDGPMTGWDLVATAQELIGDFWALNQSQVYRELSAMAGNGLVEAGEPGPRDRRPYTVTDAGREAFAAWVRRGPGAETVRFPLLLTIVFGRHLPPGRLAEIVDEHRSQHQERLDGYERLATDLAPDPYARATLDFGLTYERAVLDWFDHLPPEIRGT
jgi:DNA-binding PadR family transcriptional regulator